MLIDVRLFSVGVVMNYAFEEVGQKDPRLGSVFRISPSRAILYDLDLLPRQSRTFQRPPEHSQLMLSISSFTGEHRQSCDVRAISSALSLSPNNAAPVFTRGLTFAMESPDHHLRRCQW
jgi:hypothetical protein